MIYALYLLFSIFGIAVCYFLKRYLSGPNLGVGGLFIYAIPLIFFGSTQYSIAFGYDLIFFQKELGWVFSDDDDFFFSCAFVFFFIHIGILPSKK